MMMYNIKVDILNRHCNNCKHLKLVNPEGVDNFGPNTVFTCKYHTKCEEKYETVLDYYKSCIDEIVEECNATNVPT